MERAVVIYNPTSRNAPKTDRLASAAATFRADDWEIGLLPTEGPGHATRLAAAAAADGVSVAFACGGDGTLNEVVNGIAGTETRGALIRGGMGNVFAKEIGVPRSVEAAMRVLLDGEERRFDLGVAGGRYFLCMCGLGLDADVVRKVPARAKRLLGSASLVLWGALEAPLRRGVRARIQFGEGDEQELDLYWALLGNTRSYGGVINVTANAVVDDGLLDAYVFAGRRLPIGIAARVALGRHHTAPGVELRRVAQLEIPTPGIGVQADGEYFGETPMSFSVAPGALRFLLPSGKGRQLFSD